MAEMPWGTVLVGSTTTFLPSARRDALLGGHDDVLVVGQDEDDLGGGVRRSPGGCPRWRGSWSGRRDTMPSTPRSRNTAARPSPAHTATKPNFFSGGGDQAAACLARLQLGLHGVQVVGALDMLARGQVVGLGAHVLDLGQLQGAVLLGLGQGAAGDVGVDVDLEGLVVLADDQAVADAVADRPAAAPDPLLRPFLRTMNTGVKGEGDLLRRRWSRSRPCPALRLSSPPSRAWARPAARPAYPAG